MTADNNAPAIIDDHPFEPRAQWFTTCRRCGLAEAAHTDAVGECQVCGTACAPGEDLCDWCESGEMQRFIDTRRVT